LPSYDKYREETLKGMSGVVVGARPMLSLRAASLPGGQLPAQSELFLVDGRLYAMSNGGTRPGMATSSCRCGSIGDRRGPGIIENSGTCSFRALPYRFAPALTNAQPGHN
jgi:hypothetical protein